MESKQVDGGVKPWRSFWWGEGDYNYSSGLGRDVPVPHNAKINPYLLFL